MHPRPGYTGVFLMPFPDPLPSSCLALWPAPARRLGPWQVRSKSALLAGAEGSLAERSRELEETSSRLRQAQAEVEGQKQQLAVLTAQVSGGGGAAGQRVATRVAT